MGDKLIYRGSFKDGFYDGLGELINTEEGTKYTGDWKKGLMHGKGRFEWKNGNSYKGHYKDNIKEGEGEFRWTDGTIY